LSCPLLSCPVTRVGASYLWPSPPLQEHEHAPLALAAPTTYATDQPCR